MARAFATNQQISGSYTVHKNQQKLTMACWIRRPTSGTIQNVGFTDVVNNGFVITHYSDNFLYPMVANNSNSYGYVAQNITGWNHFALVFDGSLTGNSNRMKLYRNGSLLTLGFNLTIPSTTSNNASINNLRLGRNETGNYWSSGDFAEYGLWQEALSVADVAALAKGMTPDKARPDKLVSYIPLVRDIQDVRSGTTLTDTSTTVATHPRVYA